MAGTIDLNSVIAMMNAAAEDSRQGAAMSTINLNPQPTPLKKKTTPTAGKEAFESITQPAANAQPVDPNSQVSLIQSLDAKQQNYLMQAFNIVNGGMA